MVEGDDGGNGEFIEGRRRSEGGERDTRKRRREEGEVAKEALKAECDKCGNLIFYIVKEKGVQVEMGHKGCCTLRKVECQLGERRSGKKPYLDDNWEGAAGRERVVKMTAEELSKRKRKTAERKATGKMLIRTKSERNRRRKEMLERNKEEKEEEEERKRQREEDGRPASVVTLAPPRSSSTPGRSRKTSFMASSNAAATQKAEDEATSWAMAGYPSWRKRPASSASASLAAATSRSSPSTSASAAAS